MATVGPAWTQEFVDVAGARLQLARGGNGDPLLILHDELGHHDLYRYHEALAQEYTLYIPSHPGFGETERQEWIMNMRDLAGWYLEAIEDMGLQQVNLLGFSLGGWLAAEMASMSPNLFKKLVLVGPAGIKPPTGEIYDMFLAVATEYLIEGFYDPENTAEFQQACPDEPSAELTEAWEVAREEACRLSWRPYMYYPGLPNLLHRLKNLPTQIIWGREDNIVPVSASRLYHQSIPGSRVDILENCGHRPELEKTDDFLRLVKDFLSS